MHKIAKKVLSLIFGKSTVSEFQKYEVRVSQYRSTIVNEAVLQMQDAGWEIAGMIPYVCCQSNNWAIITFKRKLPCTK